MDSRGTGDRPPGSEVDGMSGARGREEPEHSALKALSVTPRPRAAVEAGLARPTFHPLLPKTGQ